MSLHIPGLSRGRHRGKSGLQLQRELDAAERRIIALTAGIDQISAERNGAEGRADDTAMDLEAANEEIQRLEKVVDRRDQQIADLKLRLEARVKAEHVVAETQELDGEEIRRHCIRPVPLHEAPFATTNPGRVRPSWAKDDPAA